MIDWTVFWISMAVLLFLFDSSLGWAIIISGIVGWAVFTVELTEDSRDTLMDELSKVVIQLEDTIDKNKDSNIELPPEKPEPTKGISTKTYDDVKRVYISNSKRTFTPVQMKTLAGKIYACMKDDTCIYEPTMKRHIDDVLYACESDICYPVQ